MKKLLVFTVLISILILISGKVYYESKLENIESKAAAAQAEDNIKNEKIATIEQSIYKEIPGIVAWGDSLTAGAGGEGVTYPKVLQELISENIYDIPVINMGVGGESTNTIVGRSGSVPFVVNGFTIPENNSKVEIEIESSSGADVAPLRQGDGGINPVTISDVKGRISIEQESPVSERYTYYFQRSKLGESVKVKDGTPLKLKSDKEFNNFVPIVFMGQNGGFETTEELIDQINSILGTKKANQKYLVLGLTTGDASSRASLEQSMETEFGERYLNLREYVSENGLEISGLEPTKKDLQAMEIGSVPPSLLSDKIHFNSYGYKVIGQAVYEKMKNLGYFEDISKRVDKINSL